MWYTHYKKVKEENLDLVNDLYRDVLSLITIKDWRNLLDVYNSDKDLEWDAEEYFHEYSRDNDKNITLANYNSDWWFCKTARKLYDIAVVIGYAFDSYLSNSREFSSDCYRETEWHIDSIIEWMEDKNKELVLEWLVGYIKAELDIEDYKEEDLEKISEKVVEYCKANTPADEEEEEERDYEEEKEQDLNEIAESIWMWYTSWQTWNWNSWYLEYNQII